MNSITTEMPVARPAEPHAPPAPPPPSLSRDFVLLSVIIVVLACLASVWIGFETYEDHSQRILKRLEVEATRIDRTLTAEMENSSYLLESLARQISRNPQQEPVMIARLLRSFSNNTNGSNVFAWVDAEQRVIASSNSGLLNEPVDVSDRDYVKKSLAEPWQVQIGRPIEGRVSKKWVIPMAIGLADDTGKFLGTIVISVEIAGLTQKIAHVVNAQDISFSIVSLTYGKITQLSGDEHFTDRYFPSDALATLDLRKNPRGVFSRARPFSNSSIYAYYELCSAYPYILLIGDNSRLYLHALVEMLLPRIVLPLVVAAFMVSFLWMVRLRVIRPVIELTRAVADMARGNPFRSFSRRGPAEIETLQSHIQRIQDLLNEREKLENELRHKMQMLWKAKETAEFTNRVKIEFLASLSKELRNPLNSVVGFAEVMQSEMYGPIGNEHYRQYVQDILRAGQQLVEVINDVLQLSRAESGLLEMAEKPHDVAGIVRRVLRLTQEKAQEQQVQIITQFGEDLPKLLIDELRLKQIVLNLINHALKVTPAGRDIRIELRLEQEKQDHPQLVLQVTDGAEGSGTRVIAKPIETRGLNLRGEQLRKRGKLDLGELSGLGIPLTKTLVTMVGAGFAMELAKAGQPGVTTIRFPKEKLVFWDAPV